MKNRLPRKQRTSNESVQDLTTEPGYVPYRDYDQSDESEDWSQ